MGIGNWLRRTGAAVAKGFRRFMVGRYGSDRLNVVLIWTSFGLYILSLLLPFRWVRLGLILSSYLVVGWAIFRFVSRNTYKRYRENRKFLRFVEKVKDREHKHFDCPRCRQPVRVPRGKGKIAITCPKCREKFVKRT